MIVSDVKSTYLQEPEFNDLIPETHKSHSSYEKNHQSFQKHWLRVNSKAKQHQMQIA